MSTPGMMTGAEHQEWVALIDRFYARLEGATRERKARSYFLPSGELAWVVFERGVLLDAVNAARTARGLPAIESSAVERAENSAVGHSDYTRKFAIGCARLVVEEGV